MHVLRNARLNDAGAAPFWRALLMLLLGALATLLPTGPAQAQTLQPVPALARRVTDLTGTLDGAFTVRLESKLATLEQRTGAQIAVLILDSTHPEAVEQFATRVFEAWRLGRRGVDDGVLLLVARQDHKMRIEVGYGLEGAITDVKSSRINRDIMAPAFRQGDFGGGIDRAVDALIALVPGSGAPIVVTDTPAPQVHNASAPPSEHLSFEAFALLASVVLGLIGGPVLATRWSRWRWMLPAAALMTLLLAGGFSTQDWKGALLGLPITMLSTAAIGAAIWDVFFRTPAQPASGVTSRPRHPAKRRKTSRPRKSGRSRDSSGTTFPWDSSRSSSSDSGSDSSDSGSFSGGGGDSGGGGSSDSW
jgi:uncharacterized protein